MSQFDFLLHGVSGVTPQMAVMWAVGGLLIWLAVKKDFEPSLLLPMGFGAILVNLPYTGVLGDNGIIEWLFNKGIASSEAMPLLLFVGIGAMIDFGPLLSNPRMILFGAAAQFGIFFTISAAVLLGFPLRDAMSIGVIGAADGPTSILVSQVLDSAYKGAVAVAAYSYMALVPLIQPFAIRLVTTKKERSIRMPYQPDSVSKTTKILFPIIVTMIAGLIAPDSVALVGLLMFGNLIRECGRLESLSKAAQGPLANLITIFLGITIAFQMRADVFVRWNTLAVMALGLVAFVFDSVGGVLFAKLLNLFLPEGRKFNPMVGAAGISAFPMSARVIQKMGLKEDNQNHLLMHAIGANVAGQIGSVVAGGIILSLASNFLA
ncbi:Glutaconyl-CoA decarboxylase subunit beta [Caprobacter fermentans]|uniref:Glutaconyl-CoA decarboxylase subunit beta n=2 Tax=Caproicibacter fermentans TaxID=2576756 RepID=A0A6N8I3I6_9FIRM|nr:Glutaconyl-CoA decarboxylase subunit beta [Caproicibacter fermentans]